MAIQVCNLVNRVKSEWHISTTVDDAKLTLLIEEAISYLQRFKDDTITEELSPNAARIIMNYVAWKYDNNEAAKADMYYHLELERDK